VIEYEEFIPVALAMLEESKKKSSAPAGSGMPRLSEVPAEMLERYLAKLFAVADTNGDGVLQPDEFKRLLEMSGFNLSAQNIARLLDAADVNHDGVIEYEEFIPVALAMLDESKRAKSASNCVSEAQAQEMLLNTYTRPQLERMMKKTFLFADTDCSGYLDYQEFKNCLSSMGLPLTQSQASAVMMAVDVNRDGKVSYEEFVPLCFELIVKAMCDTVEPIPTQPKKPARVAAVPAEPEAPVAWDSYSTLYRSRGPAAALVSKVTVGARSQQPHAADVASLEGRVLSVQCRRIIRSKVKDLFGQLDTDHDGQLSMDELSLAVGQSVAAQMMAVLDRNQDGFVSQYEMRRFFDDECARQVASGVPEYKYLENVVRILETGA